VHQQYSPHPRGAQPKLPWHEIIEPPGAHAPVAFSKTDISPRASRELSGAVTTCCARGRTSPVPIKIRLMSGAKYAKCATYRRAAPQRNVRRRCTGTPCGESGFDNPLPVHRGVGGRQEFTCAAIAREASCFTVRKRQSARDHAAPSRPGCPRSGNERWRLRPPRRVNTSVTICSICLLAVSRLRTAGF